jgi:hypothetical protein
MKRWLQKNKLGIAGLVVGGILGFAYYYFIGCSSGTCAITSRPLNSSLFGMLMGYLAFSVFQPKEKMKE